MVYNLAVTEEDISNSLKSNGDWNPVHHDRNAAKEFLMMVGKGSNENGLITPGVIFPPKIINLSEFKDKDVDLMELNIDSPLSVDNKKEIKAEVTWDDKKGMHKVLLSQKVDFHGQEVDGVFLKAYVGLKKEDLNEKINALEKSVKENKEGIVIEDKIDIAEDSLKYYIKSAGLPEEAGFKNYGIFASSFIPTFLLKLSDKLESRGKEGHYFFKYQNLILNGEDYSKKESPLSIFGKVKSRMLKGVELCFSDLAIVDKNGKPLAYSSNTTGKMLK